MCKQGEFEYDGLCYSIFLMESSLTLNDKRKLSVQNAKDACLKKNMTLIRIENEKKAKFIYQLVKYSSVKKFKIPYYDAFHLKYLLIPFGKIKKKIKK